MKTLSDLERDLTLVIFRNGAVTGKQFQQAALAMAAAYFEEADLYGYLLPHDPAPATKEVKQMALPE